MGFGDAHNNPELDPALLRAELDAAAHEIQRLRRRLKRLRRRAAAEWLARRRLRVSLRRIAVFAQHPAGGNDKTERLWDMAEAALLEDRLRP